MMGETHNCKKAKPTAVDLAVAALDGNPSPLDMDMRAIDPDPTSLDLALPGKPDDRHAAETGADWRQSKKAVRNPKKVPPASPR
jgi:hypothetical protein